MLAKVRSGLLGGTFDPPHIAHLLAGEVAYRQLGLDRVVFIPAGSPWQKAGRKVSSAHHRSVMSRLAVEGVDYFEADEREVHRDGWTYTADTLDGFDPTEELVLILGADAARGLPTWERSADVLARAQVAVVPRPGVGRSEVDSLVKVERWLDMPALPLSGTLIRQRAAAGFDGDDGVRDPGRYLLERRGAGSNVRATPAPFARRRELPSYDGRAESMRCASRRGFSSHGRRSSPSRLYWQTKSLRW